MRYQLDLETDYFPNLDPSIWSTLHLRHIYKRVHQLRFNFLGMIVGKHRTGKSLAGLSFAHMLDPTFFPNLEDRVVYYADDFMRALEDIRRKNIIGGAIVWDEAGVGVPSREWYNISNKAVGLACQVFGRYRPIIFFVTQDVTYIDSQIRKLFHGFYEMQRMSDKFAIAKPFNVSYNKRIGKVYYRYGRFYSTDMSQSIGKRVLKAIKLQRPPRKMEARYDDHSKEFKDLIMEQMQERTESYTEDRDRKKWDIKDIIKELAVNHYDDPEFLSKRSKPDSVIFDKDAIRFMYDISDSKARFIKKQSEVKVKKMLDEGEIDE